jgi:hypothetical protein
MQRDLTAVVDSLLDAMVTPLPPRFDPVVHGLGVERAMRVLLDVIQRPQDFPAVPLGASALPIAASSDQITVRHFLLLW